MIAAARPRPDGDIAKLAKQTVKYIDLISKWTGYIFAPLCIVYMLMLIYEVVMRYGFNSPTNWAHELSTFLFGAQFMLGGAYCLWRSSMPNVDLVHNHLPFRFKNALDCFTMLFPLAICLLMFWIGGQMFLHSLELLERTNTVWAPPLYPLRGVIPLAALIMLLQVVAQWLRRLYAAFTGRPMEIVVEAATEAYIGEEVTD